ncbi:MAG: hypothetical protein WKF73_04275 [Nocardioidaceae bacterium]
MTAGPPFERYPVSSGTIFAQSQAISSKASALASVGANVQSAAQPSAGSVSGLLAPPLISAPRPVLDQTQQLIQTTTLAAGAVRVFALAIETHDAAIDSLNERWNTAVADDFGVPAAVMPAGADQQESRDIEADRAQAVSAAREELRRELRAEQRTLEEAVDDSADQVASMLQQGPTASNLSTVASAGGFNGLPAEVLVSLPAGIVRSVVLATAEEFAKGMARTSPGLIGPLRFPGSPLFSYTQPNPSPAQARWLAWAKGLKIGGTAVGFGVTGVNQHLKDLKQYPNMDTEERVGRDGGAILSKALPAARRGRAHCCGHRERSRHGPCRCYRRSRHRRRDRRRLRDRQVGWPGYGAHHQRRRRRDGLGLGGRRGREGLGRGQSRRRRRSGQ